MDNPILKALDALLDDQEQIHAWLFEAGEQIRAWREEDRLAGDVWEIDQSTPRERRVGNGSPVNK